MRKKICTFFLFFLVGRAACCQRFQLQELKTISANQILTGSYTKIELCAVFQNNLFDSKNPYTYLEILNDENGVVYHILYQTDFSGLINHISISNNLTEKFNCRPKIYFCSCIKKINQQHFDSVKTTAIIDCIMSQLNLCVE